MTTGSPDAVAAIEAGFAAGTPTRLAALEKGLAPSMAARIAVLDVQAQATAQRAADALARGERDAGVLLLICALTTTEEIDHLEGNPPS